MTTFHDTWQPTCRLLHSSRRRSAATLLLLLFTITHHIHIAC